MENLILPDASSISSVVTCTIEGILELDDIKSLTAAVAAGEAAAPREDDDPTNIKRLRERHHSLARLIASGMGQRMAAGITGYTENYVSILLNTPAMDELVTLYRSKYGNAAEVITERLRSVGTQAVEALSDRMADPVKLDSMNAFELSAIAKLGLDRAGHGPSSTSTVVEEKHLIDHAEILRLNQAATASSAEYIIPIRDVRAAALPAPDGESDA